MVDIDKIKVSSRLDDIIENSVDEGYSYVCKQRIKRKNVMLRVAAVILGFSLLGGVFQNQVSAEVRLAIMKIEDYLGLDRSLDDYKSIVEKTISKNGITMQLNEVILDNDEVIVSYTVMSQEDLDEDKDIVTSGDVYINGKKLSNGSTGGSVKGENNTREVVLCHDLNEKVDDEELDVSIKFNEVYIGGNEITGPWEFNFKSSIDKLNKSVECKKLNKTFMLDNGEKITFTEYRKNDVGEKIYYSIEGKKELYALELKGYDEQGNEVEFYNSNEKKTSGVMKKQSGNIEYSSRLKLKLYAAKYPEKSEEMKLSYSQVGEEFTID